MELNDKQKTFIDKKLDSLSKSKFRSSFKLRKKEYEYMMGKTIDEIEEHAFKFIVERLKCNNINDGKQTPMKGHPVFIAQHATGTCCRGCLYKWHHISKDKVLEDREINFVVALIMEWIKRNMKG